MSYVENLNETDKKILLDYTTDSYKSFNQRLRDNLSLSIEQAKMLKTLENIYDETPLLKESITVYRGTKTDISKLNKNNTYISTSLNYAIAKERFAGINCCLLQITVHPNTKVLPLVEISDSPDEDEILLDKNGYITYSGTQERDGVNVYLADYHSKQPVSIKTETKEIDTDSVVARLFNILKRDEDEDPDDYILPSDEYINKTYSTVFKTQNSIPEDVLLKLKERLLTT